MGNKPSQRIKNGEGTKDYRFCEKAAATDLIIDSRKQNSGNGLLLSCNKRQKNIENISQTYDHQVVTLLEGIGLEKYASKFQQSNISVSVLPLLNLESLQRLGLNIGDSLLVLSAVSSCCFSTPSCGAHLWTKEQVSQWLTDIVKLPECAEVFLRNEIDGQLLVSLTPNELKNDLGIENFSKRKAIVRAIEELNFLHTVHVDAEKCAKLRTQFGAKTSNDNLKGPEISNGVYAMYIKVKDEKVLKSLEESIKSNCGFTVELIEFSVVLTTFTIDQKSSQQLGKLLSALSENEPDDSDSSDKDQTRENSNEKDDTDSIGEKRKEIVKEIRSMFPVSFSLSGFWIDRNTICVGISGNGTNDCSISSSSSITSFSSFDSSPSLLSLPLQHIAKNNPNMSGTSEERSETNLQRFSESLQRLFTLYGILSTAQRRPVACLELRDSSKILRSFSHHDESDEKNKREQIKGGVPSGTVSAFSRRTEEIVHVTIGPESIRLQKMSQ